MGFDAKRIEELATELLLGIGEDPTREGLKETPRRMAGMYQEILSGIDKDPIQVLGTQFEVSHGGMVLLRDIPFFSVCEHHLLPFFGVTYIGYIPQSKIVGISKLARGLDIIAKRLQIQERLTDQLADAIMEAVNPVAVAIVIEAEHLCMAMRGVNKSHARFVTVAVRGDFRDQKVTQAEFLDLLMKKEPR